MSGHRSLRNAPGLQAGEGPRWVNLGCIKGPFGRQGAVRVQSHAQDKAWILHFTRWWLGDPAQGRMRQVQVVAGHPHGPGLAVELEGIHTREAAQALTGLAIHTRRRYLPEHDHPDEHYWVDLVGCRVVEEDGAPLGQVAYLLDTGANDVLAVTSATGEERLLPYIEDVIRQVDMAQRIITVRLMPGL